MGSYFSSDGSRSGNSADSAKESSAKFVDGTFLAVSDGSEQVGKGRNQVFQGSNRSGAGVSNVAQGFGNIVSSPVCGIRASIFGNFQPGVHDGSDTYARRTYTQAVNGELRSEEDLLNSNQLPNWFHVINDKLTKSGYCVRDGDSLRPLTVPERAMLVTCLGDKDLFFEAFFKGKFDLAAIQNEVREMEVDMREMKEEATAMDEAFEQEARRLEALRLRAAKGDGELPVSIFFSEGNWLFNHIFGRAAARLGGFQQGWIIHAGLDIGGITVEWGAGPCGASLVFPRISMRTILAKIVVQRKSLFDRFLDGLLHPLDTLKQWLYALSLFFQRVLGQANQSSLFEVADVCTRYNRRQIWGPVNCNCQKFVVDVLNRLGLKFSPNGEMKAFIDRINAGIYELSITGPNGKKFVFESVVTLDEFAKVRWEYLPPWSKYLLVTYNSIISERALADIREGARNGSPWVRLGCDIQDNEKAWRDRVQEVTRILKN